LPTPSQDPERASTEVSKSNKNRERREMVEQMRREAKAAERRRSLIVVAGCVVVALIIVGVATFKIVQDNREQDRLASEDLAQIGASATAAGCTEVKEEDATGAGQHVTTPVIYETVPPSYGAHNPTSADAGVHFYTAEDRPELEMLVHNLEHGWTIVWYDESVAADDDAVDVLKGTAKKFDQFGSDPQYDVIFAPWLPDDGEGQPIPDGKHIAFTHWSIHQPEFDAQVYQDAADSGDDIPSWGESQYCSTFSGAALDDFMTKYPYDDAPEGYLWHR
jgi:hypothetical protein